MSRRSRTTHAERAARRRGRLDYDKDISYFDCPYGKGNDQSRAWRAGWSSAKVLKYITF